MKSISKLLIDIGPLAIFFIFYTRSGLQASILPFMIATVIAVLFSYILEKKNTNYAYSWSYYCSYFWRFNNIF